MIFSDSELFEDFIFVICYPSEHHETTSYRITATLWRFARKIDLGTNTDIFRILQRYDGRQLLIRSDKKTRRPLVKIPANQQLELSAQYLYPLQKHLKKATPHHKLGDEISGRNDTLGSI